MAYTLLSGLYDHMTKEQEFNVVLLGMENAGKTTFLERLKTQHSTKKGLKPDQIVPTIGLNIGKLPNIHGHRLFVCDIGGQLRTLWDAYYQDCHGIIFFIDSSDHQNFQRSLESFASVIKHQELQNVPILLLANKQDISGCEPITALLEKLKPLEVDLGDRVCRVQPLSALEGYGVDEGLGWLVQHMDFNQSKKPKRPAE